MKHIFKLILLIGFVGWASFFGCTDVKPVKPVGPGVTDTLPAFAAETPVEFRYCRTISPTVGGPQDRAVGDVSTYWAQKKVITVGFPFGGTPAQIAFVKSALSTWDNITNLSFVYPAQGPYDVRWAFDPSYGAYSYVGKACATISQDRPTGNVGWGWNSNDLDGVARHEVAHMCGGCHEQCNKNSTIQWNKEIVYADLAKPPNMWSRQTVDHNVFMVCSGTKYQSTAWDSLSILQYSIPARWTLNNKAIAGGQKLSPTDIQFWGTTVYPNGNTPPPPPPAGSTTITNFNLDRIVRLQTLSATYSNMSKIYADSALFMMRTSGHG